MKNRGRKRIDGRASMFEAASLFVEKSHWEERWRVFACCSSHYSKEKRSGIRGKGLKASLIFLRDSVSSSALRSWVWCNARPWDSREKPKSAVLLEQVTWRDEVTLVELRPSQSRYSYVVSRTRDPPWLGGKSETYIGINEPRQTSQWQAKSEARTQKVAAEFEERIKHLW